MNLLLTAAGAGSRFLREGVLTPKPLILVKGRELLRHTLDSFRLEPGDRLLLGVQRSHGVRERLDRVLREEFAGVELRWVELDVLLPGQLSTAIACVEEAWSDDRAALAAPLLIHNCDTGFAWPSIEGRGALVPQESYGTMAVFEAEGEHWSFGRPDPRDPLRAVEIREKQRISGLASIGLYGFRHTGEFLQDARSWCAAAPPVRGEHYVAPLLDAALGRGATVLLPRVEDVKLYGTPAELCATFAITMAQLAAMNRGPLEVDRA